MPPGQGSLFRTIRKMKARSGTPRRAVLPYAGRLDPGGMEMVDGGTREAPDRAATSSGVGYGQDLVVNQSRREGQRLPNIFVL